MIIRDFRTRWFLGMSAALLITAAAFAKVPSACAAPVLAFNKPAAGGSAWAIHGKARAAPMGRSPM